MRSSWVQHGGRRILYLNYAGFKSDVAALRAEVESADQEICRQAEGSVLALADLRDTTASAAVVEMFKASTTRTKPFIGKLALVGIQGLKRFLAEMVARVSGREMRLFDAEADAIAWLIGKQADGGIAIGPLGSTGR